MHSKERTHFVVLHLWVVFLPDNLQTPLQRFILQTQIIKSLQSQFLYLFSTGTHSFILPLVLLNETCHPRVLH